MQKMCVICGKEFETKTAAKTCSEECKIELKVRTKRKCNKRSSGKPVGRPRKHKEYIYRPTKNDTLCWSCQNATGGCSWSKKLKPVRGWKAEKIKVKGDFYTSKIVDSYIVKSCPKFKADVLRGKIK